jgi:hypothetical protein
MISISAANDCTIMRGEFEIAACHYLTTQVKQTVEAKKLRLLPARPTASA